MNATAPQPVAVSILDREYLVACTPDERAGLVAAAALLDGRMREVRNAARSATVDRIAVLAALNLAHELLQQRHSASHGDGALEQQIAVLKGRLDGALAALGPR
ncbi:MAG: cell division protein ZapA [Xanthomonadaceae bacterium]|jgi:cell division protein ZapA|nr:cell division protein ZapA [Xanthomonadaceae bacterium]